MTTQHPALDTDLQRLPLFFNQMGPCGSWPKTTWATTLRLSAGDALAKPTEAATMETLPKRSPAQNLLLRTSARLQGRHAVGGCHLG